MPLQPIIRRVCCIVAASVFAFLLASCAKQPQKNPAKDFTAVPPGAGQSTAQTESVSQATQQLPGGTLPYRGVWISYQEWAHLDTSSEAAFTQSVATMLEHCVSLGLNCVIVQVRPFGDAIYPSDLFPWSHVVTGVQGQDPGYDPLAIFIEQAHTRGLALEAWINPYRVRLTETIPKGELAANNPALLHSDWVIPAGKGLFFNPALPEVQQLIIDGTVEILQRYDVDGIQMDDYFYPTTDASFDAETFASLGGGKSLEEWRRENVNTLVRQMYAAIKQEKPDMVFGISPQGNNEQNYNKQYSDVGLWLSTPGYVDYIMPQVYWGYGYTLQNGGTQYGFENITKTWAEMPRDPSVSLAFGLGAYRIGCGDSGKNDQSEWKSGKNLAAMTQTLAQTDGVKGFALFRYSSLFHAGEYDALAQQEQQALREVNTP